MPQPASSSDDRFVLVRLSVDCLQAFARFLKSLDTNGDTEFFHPHAFDAAAARSVTARSESG